LFNFFSFSFVVTIIVVLDKDDNTSTTSTSSATTFAKGSLGFGSNLKTRQLEPSQLRPSDFSQAHQAVKLQGVSNLSVEAVRRSSILARVCVLQEETPANASRPSVPAHKEKCERNRPSKTCNNFNFNLNFNFNFNLFVCFHQLSCASHRC
jgi:hypothetical protein